uniref:CSON007048 protein n=1 Tax=Culicoides sonorensis TaxID=179676 RepID=A0A336MTI5_CULSO
MIVKKEITRHGMVSTANISTPASIQAAIRRRCQSLIVSGDTRSAYDPEYSLPSWDFNSYHSKNPNEFSPQPQDPCD